jgi:hypothetical protein
MLHVEKKGAMSCAGNEASARAGSTNVFALPTVILHPGKLHGLARCPWRWVHFRTKYSCTSLHSYLWLRSCAPRSWVPSGKHLRVRWIIWQLAMFLAWFGHCAVVFVCCCILSSAVWCMFFHCTRRWSSLEAVVFLLLGTIYLEYIKNYRRRPSLLGPL